MYQQSSSRPLPQLPSGRSQPRPVPCYNCGAFEHLVMACPEPTRAVPAGLAAAKAAQAAQATQAAQFPESADGGRPYKRQKTGPVVTRFPAPAAGPVVTHYAPPPTQAPQFATSVNQSYYGPQSMQACQHYPNPHPYIQSAVQQPTMPANTYGLQPISNSPYGYTQPAMPGGSQVCGQPVPPIQQSYMNPTASIPSQLHGYQTSRSPPYPAGAYSALPASQQYSHNNQMLYGQQQMVGYSPQTYPDFQGASPMLGQPPQQYPPYQGPSPIQTGYIQSPPSNQQQIGQNHGQFPMNSPVYAAPAYQGVHAQYQLGYHNQYRKSQYPKPPYKPSRFGQHNYKHNHSAQSPVPPLNQQSYAPTTFQQQPDLLKARKPSSTAGSQQEGQASPSQYQERQNTDEVGGFDWDLEKAFVEIEHKTADEIAHPLPSHYSEEVILPPACDAKSITSKYVRPHNLEIFVRDIRSSLNWAIIMGDPVFKEIDYDSPPIPLDQLKAWVKTQVKREQSTVFATEEFDQGSPVPQKALWYDGPNDDPTHNALRQPDVFVDHRQSPVSPSPLQPSKRPSFNRSKTPVLGQTTPGIARSCTPSFGIDDDVWAPQPGEGQISTSPPEDHTEALLASLGVTGSPKPVSQKPTTFYSAADYKEEFVQELPAPHPSRQDSGYASQRGSYSAADNTTIYGDYRQSYDGNNPPPPPPPPPRHIRRQFDGTIDSPPSDGSGRAQAGPGVPSSDNQNGLQQGSSPLTPISAESATHDNTLANDRKKKQAPLRQVDDITPKLKKRQPKVAEAYRCVNGHTFVFGAALIRRDNSRRW